MVTRLLLALALVAATAQGAVAAPVVCNLLTDPANDVMIAGPTGPKPYVDAALDVRSADVVSDGTGVGVTLRLGSIPMQPTSLAGTDLGIPDVSYKVFVTFAASGAELIYEMRAWGDNATGAVAGAAGMRWTFEAGKYYNDSQHKYDDRYFIPYAATSGVVDPVKKEVRTSVTWADLKRWGYPRVKGDRAVNVHVLARDLWFSQNRDPANPFDPGHALYDTSPRDEAATKASYVFGTKTCTTRG